MPMKVRYTTINGEVIAENRGGVRKQYIPDTLGSMVALMDSSQTLTDTFNYWPYGEVASQTGTTVTPFQYVGTSGYYHDDANRMYVRARSLNASLGCWLTLDRYWKTEGMYLYARSSPVNWPDPSGLSISVDPSCNKPPFNAAQILASAKAACKSLNAKPPCWGCCVADSISSAIAEICITQFCSDMKINCKTNAQCNAPKPSGGCGKGGNVDRYCGCTPVDKGPVTICPPGMTRQKSGCDCLSSTIMHEFMHACFWPGEQVSVCVETNCRKGIPGC